MALRLNLLGGLFVERDGRAMASGAAAQPRRLAVLALIARSGERGVARDRVMSMLWPDANEERARRALTQAIYALRQDLGDEDAIVGVKDLRLDESRVATDIGDFERALAREAVDDAVAVYRGPFLDGFHLPGADDFSRWVDTERQGLEHDHASALERLARAAAARGDRVGAVAWWRRVAVNDPLNARVAVALMQALADAGDPLGAIQHARVHEALVEQQLDLPPDREVLALASKLRKETRRAAASLDVTQETAVISRPEPLASAIADAPLAPGGPPEIEDVAPPSGARHQDSARVIEFAHEPSVSRGAPPEIEDAPAPADRPNPIPADAATTARKPVALPAYPPPLVAPLPPVHAPDASPPNPAIATATRATRRSRALISAGVLLATAAAATFAIRARGGPSSGVADPDAPVLVVGRISDYDAGAERSLARPLGDMLATNLARAPGLRVVSTARMYELVGRLARQADDTSSGTIMAAARQSGATDIIDGAVYREAPGRLRLDLRRVDVATGAVRRAYTVEAADLFALADSGALHLVKELRVTLPPGSLADVTTRSAVAYRLYEEGLRALARDDRDSAAARFGAALAEDSTFAMAAYYHTFFSADGNVFRDRIERAMRLSAHATDRERLIIRAKWASFNTSPDLHAIAESLATRYPDEVQGHLLLGVAQLSDGEFAAAIPSFERVIAMDSANLRAASINCDACAAYNQLVVALALLDSIDAARRVSEEWIRRQPTSPTAQRTLVGILAANGETNASLAMLRDLQRRQPAASHWSLFVDSYLRAQAFDSAERAATHGTGEADDRVWWRAIILRYRGRPREAEELIRRYPGADVHFAPSRPGERVLYFVPLLEGQTMLERGDFAGSAALFDSLARIRLAAPEASAYASNRSWMLTHAAEAYAAAGDTGRLAALADTIQRDGLASLSGRNRRLHFHVRGLLLAARGQHAEAVDAFRKAIFSSAWGYTRTNLALAKSLLVLHRPAESVATLRAALHGPLDGSNFYVTQSELHEGIARAFDALGRADSAVAHYDIVARSWSGGEAPYAARAAAAQRRAAELRARSSD